MHQSPVRQTTNPWFSNERGHHDTFTQGFRDGGAVTGHSCRMWRGGQIGDAAAQFGQSFAAAFRSTDTAEPSEPGAVTYLQVAGENLTADPVDF